MVLTSWLTKSSLGTCVSVVNDRVRNEVVCFLNACKRNDMVVGCEMWTERNATNDLGISGGLWKQKKPGHGTHQPMRMNFRCYATMGHTLHPVLYHTYTHSHTHSLYIDRIHRGSWDINQWDSIIIKLISILPLIMHTVLHTSNIKAVLPFVSMGIAKRKNKMLLDNGGEDFNKGCLRMQRR